MSDGRWPHLTRYPDPAVEVLDPAFARYRLFAAHVELLASGFRWAEGPAWFGDHRCLLFSDVPGDRILRWDEETGAVTPFRAPSGHSNGLARDRQGRLLACEHGSRSLTRTEHDGTRAVLAERFEGKRLNSPNDVVVKSDGSIWFTDPPFGILGHYEGARAQQELPTHVYRLDPATGALRVATGAVVRPNGLAFSPDESLLYVVSSDPAGRAILAFAVRGDGTLDGGRTLLRCAEDEAPDGLRVDADGNLWCGWGSGPGRDGVRVFSPEGRPIGHVHLPVRCANLCFGGRHRNRLFMTAGTSLFSLYTEAQGAGWPSP